MKRKQAPVAPPAPAAAPSKRPKKEESPARRADFAETETDSDPIIDSDTGSESGDDDGVSWPSDGEIDAVDVNDAESGDDDEEEDEKDQWDGLDEENGNQDSRKPKDKLVNGDANGVQSSSSREAHRKQKEMAQERKAAKPNADMIIRSKKLWERLRRKSHVPLEERKKLVAELLEIVTGRVKDFVFKHDSVRVIQTALKYGNLRQRKGIAKELKGEYRTLSQSKYGKFLVGKIIVHGDNEVRDMVVPEFYGHVRRMIRHPEASWILDDVYRGAATSDQKAALLREWYGDEFALFKSKDGSDSAGDLSAILTQHPEKKSPILRSLLDLINQMVQKRTTGFTMLHDAMLQYLLNVAPGGEEANEFIELLKGDEEGDLLKNLAFTDSGSRLVCLALAYSNAKDRKLLLRAYRNTVQMMAYDVFAHRVLLTAYEVVDDTVMTSKVIFSELLGKDSAAMPSGGAATDDNTQNEGQQDALIAMASDKIGRLALLHLFNSSPKASSLLQQSDIDLLAEVREIRAQTSKKDPATRRRELQTHLAPTLLNLVHHSVADLATTSYGCQFVTEVLLSSAELSLDAASDVNSKVAKQLPQALSSVANFAQSLDTKSPATTAPASDVSSAAIDASIGRMFKTLASTTSSTKLSPARAATATALNPQVPMQG